jgi:maltose O-acetyltransferase
MDLKLHAARAVVRALPPFVGSRVRTGVLRAAGLRIGATSTFWDLPTFIGDVSALHIGEFCGFNAGCTFDLEGQLFIDDHVSVGHEVMFLTRITERGGGVKAAPVRVSSGAWIGARATILPGVTIGEGAVIGASVVVDKDVPAQTLVMGTQRISLAKWRTGGTKS